MEAATQEQREWRTRSLSMAAYLYAKGHQHDRLEKGEDGKAEWVFALSEQIRKCVQDYLFRDARIEPIAFNEALQRARTDLFEFLDGAAA